MNNNVGQEILKAMALITDKAIKKVRPDRTYTGVISAVNPDGYNGYVIQYNGKSIHIQASNTAIYKENDIVKICIPCENPNNAYIVLEIDEFGKVINELNENFSTGINAIGDALVAIGINVPEGSNLNDMALLIKNNAVSTS